jgi:hypothetical protein
MAELTWRNPPDNGGRQPGHVYEDEARQLREHPGEYALIKEFPLEEADSARTMGVGIRRGRFWVFRPAGAYHARTATEDSHDSRGRLVQVVNVYACYLGDGDGIAG